jgi:hypothetical protein
VSLRSTPLGWCVPGITDERRSIVPLSDILACSADRLEAILASKKPYATGSWFMAKNIGAIKLSKLGELLGVGSYESLDDGFQLVGEPLDEGPWPQTIPEALTERLGLISDSEIVSVCPNWSEFETFRGTVPADKLADYLKRLREFLRLNKGQYFLVNAL